MDRIDPMVDVVYKMIFNEKQLLRSFLNSFLDFKTKILEIPHQESTKKEHIEDKKIILVIRATTEIKNYQN